MTVDNMITSLGYRLEDPSQNEHTEDKCVVALNAGQLELANLLDPHYLTELEVLKTGVSAGNGRMALTADVLDETPLSGWNAIVRVKAQGRWIWPLDRDGVATANNYFFAGTVTDPRCYVSDGYLYLLPNTMQYVDRVIFLKVPDALAAGSTSSEMNAALHDLIVDLAEGIRWRGVDQPERADRILKVTYAKVTQMNKDAREKRGQ